MTDPGMQQNDTAEAEERRIDEIVRRGPSGALALAGIAVALVLAMWFAFYFFAFLPRGILQ